MSFNLSDRKGPVTGGKASTATGSKVESGLQPTTPNKVLSSSSTLFTRSLPTRPGLRHTPPPASGVPSTRQLFSTPSNSADKLKGSDSKFANVNPSSSLAAQSMNDLKGIDGWRSFVLDLEASLREVAIIGSTAKLTSAGRIKKVFDLFESFATASPNIQQILKLFRHEFVKAIYEPVSVVGAGAFDETSPTEVPEGEPDKQIDLAAQVDPKLIGTPYFDLVEIERREKAILTTELDVIEAESSVDDLKKQILKLQSLIPFYEHEIGRLTKATQRLDEELKRVKYSADLASQQQQSAYSALDEDYQRLARENRELLLEVQKLKKSDDAFGARGVTTAYNHLKNGKMDALQHMFERGDQEASLLLLAHQLESSLNTVLSEADRQFHRCSDAEVPSVRAKLIRNTTLILEEMHEVEDRRCSLLRAAEESGDWKATVVEAYLPSLARVKDKAPEKMDALLGSRSALLPSDGSLIEVSSSKKEHASLLLSASASFKDQNTADSPRQKPRCQSPLLRKNTTTTLLLAPEGKDTSPHNKDRPAASDDNRSAAKAKWAANAFASLLPSPTLSNVFNSQYADPSMVFTKRVTAPLADVSASKFLSGIEVFAAQAPGDAEYVQSVPYIDATHSIQLPLKSTHVKIKFMQPMRRDVRVKNGQHLANNSPKQVNTGNGQRRRAEGVPDPVAIQGNIADRNQIVSWLNEKLEGGSASASRIGGPFAQIPVAERPHATSQMDGPHWATYKTVFGSFVPYLPRLIPVEFLDLLMLRAFKLLKKKVKSRYDQCLDTAVGRSSSMQTAKMFAERLFREAYDRADLQIALLEVIEGFYCFPEQVAKVYYEVLSSLETLAGTSDSSHTSVYLQCVAGTSAPAAGHLLSLVMHSITLCWPGTTLSADEPLDEREVPMFLKMVYSNDDGIFRLTLDDLITDMLVNTNRNLTRSSIRSYFADGIESLKEYMLASQMALLTRKSIATQWAELDFEDFTDVNHSALGDTSPLYCDFLYACCTLNKTSRVPPREVAVIAVLTMKGQR